MSRIIPITAHILSRIFINTAHLYVCIDLQVDDKSRFSEE